MLSVMYGIQHERKVQLPRTVSLSDYFSNLSIYYSNFINYFSNLSSYFSIMWTSNDRYM